MRLSGAILIRHVCDAWGGTGTLPSPRCPHCGGTGEVAGAVSVIVAVPPGVRDGTRLCIQARRGGDPAFVTVVVEPDARFRRDGNEITCSLPVTLAEAALGVAIDMTSPAGALATVTVPPGSAIGARLKVDDPSLPDAVTLTAVVTVVVPTQLSVEQRAALGAFARATPAPRAHWLSSDAPADCSPGGPADCSPGGPVFGC